MEPACSRAASISAGKISVATTELAFRCSQKYNLLRFDYSVVQLVNQDAFVFFLQKRKNP